MSAEELDDLLLAARELGRAVLYHPPRGRRPAGYELVPMPAPEQGEEAAE